MTNPVTADDRRLRPGRNRRILAMLAPHLWPRGETELCARVVVAMVFLLVAKIVTVYVPIFYRDLVDTVAGRHGALVVPVALLLAYGGARALAAAFGELRDAVFAKVAQRAIRTIALRVFRHLHQLGLRFHLERRTGGLSRSLERGGKGIQFMLRVLLFNIVPTMFEVLLVAGILWRLYDWRFAAVTMAVIAAYVAFTFVVTDWRVQYMRAMNRIDTEANTRAVDSLLNYETVKYFGNEDHEAHRYDESLSGYERAAVMSTTSLSLLNLGQGTIIAVGLTISMTMAAFGVVAGTMSIGDLVLVNAYLLQLYVPLNFLGVVYREIKQSLTDMEAMFDLLDVRREVDDPPGAPGLAAARGEIEFDHVSFGYDADRGILHDVSFRVPAGRTVAVVGPSGAGKSTLSRLIYRFYDVQAGAIRIDGQDIRAVSQASLRAAIGMVPQDTVLFNDTLRYNIAYGRTDASDAEIEAAARLARIHDFIASLPLGYATLVGERGLKLSGGERQRVAIARMILKRPRIMLFDEATSALDSATEREIQRSLDEVSRDRTTLIVAHRLSTVVHADEILVLEAGRIVERGGHEALLAAGGTYAAMWARQQEVATLELSLEATMAALRRAQAAD